MFLKSIAAFKLFMYCSKNFLILKMITKFIVVINSIITDTSLTVRFLLYPSKKISCTTLSYILNLSKNSFWRWLTHSLIICYARCFCFLPLAKRFPFSIADAKVSIVFKPPNIFESFFLFFRCLVFDFKTTTLAFLHFSISTSAPNLSRLRMQR